MFQGWTHETKRARKSRAESRVAIGEWASATSLCRASVYNLLPELRSTKIGAARIILTSPSEYLERRFREQQQQAAER